MLRADAVRTSIRIVDPERHTGDNTMQRRKLLAGLGSLAAGGAAAIGSGAFNIARADRTISVENVGDDVAYLGLEETDGEYTEVNDGEISVNCGTNSQGGEGLSENANYVFTDVFKIVNNGTDEIAVTLSEFYSSISWETDYPRAYYSFDYLGTENDVNGDGDFTGATAGDGAFLPPGQQLYVHFEFVGRDEETGGSRDDLPNVIGVYAEARDGGS